MMIDKIEVVTDDIVVFKQAIDLDIAAQLESEWKDISGIPCVSINPDSEVEVRTKNKLWMSLPESSIMSRIGQMLLGDAVNDRYIALNYQRPGAAQAFHNDHKSLPVIIAHGNDDGLFDFVERGDDPGEYEIDTLDGELGCPRTLYRPVKYSTVEVSAGDVLMQLTPGIIHRGRNESDHDRYNVGFYSTR